MKNKTIMKTKLFLLLNLLMVTNLISFSQSKMGVNLSKEFAFVNLMDENTRFINYTSLDAQGWPNSDFEQIFDWRLVAEWVGPADDPEEYRINYSGTYHCSFVGQADLSVNGNVTITNQSYNSSTNTTTFNVVVPSTNNGRIFWKLIFSNTKKTPSSPLNSGISKLKVNRPGYSLTNPQTFTNEYINLCQSASFACYRFYQVNNIWDGATTYPAVTSWNNRKLPTDANQDNMVDINGKVEGWCWEYVIELANILQKDIWINLNVCFDDNYITNLATKLKAELNPNINIYVEFGNEMWNPNSNKSDFWLRDEANNLGISFNENYARNVVRISNLFASVYGASAINSKIRIILGAQQGWSGRTLIHLNYIQNTFGNPADYIWAISPACYYSGQGNSIETALNNAHTSIMKQYDDVNDDPSLLNFIQLANNYNFLGGCVSYEGQEHANIGNTNNLIVDIGKHRDPRMATEQYANFQLFFDNGGTLACQYNLWREYTRYGCWGLTDDPFNPDRNFKFKAARSLCGDVVNAMPVPSPPLPPTCLLTNKTSDTTTVLEWVDNATTEDGYEIWFKDSTSSIWKYYTTVGPDATTDTVEHLAGITYDFRVRAYNFSQWSDYNQPCDLSVEENTILNPKIYPNPSNGVYYIIAENVVEIKVYSLSGKLLYKKQSNLNSIDISNFKNGIYIVQLTTNKQQFYNKIIKQ